MFQTSNREYALEVKNNRLRTMVGYRLIDIVDFYPIRKGEQLIINGTNQGSEFTSVTSPLTGLKEGASFKVCTQHTIYTFMVKNGVLQTTCGHYAIAVTELHDLVTGKRLRVKGKRLTLTGEADCEFITSPIVGICP